MAADTPNSPNNRGPRQKRRDSRAGRLAFGSSLLTIVILLAALAAGFYVGLALREGQRHIAASLTVTEQQAAGQVGLERQDPPRDPSSPVVEGREVGVLDPRSATEQPPQAWYRSQPAPPSMVTLPDEPIYADPEPGAETVVAARPYEEALPEEVYAAPPVAAPPVASVPPPRPEAPTPLAPRRLEPGETPSPPVDALPAWQRFALAMPDPRGQPMVAVVIDDLGLDRRRTRRALELPGPLTMSFLTYADDLQRQTAAARAAGHELLLHVGMEPTGANVDPGPKVLRTGDTPGEIRRRLDWGLNRFQGFVGINNHMGSRFTSDPAGMRIVMGELKSRGLLFLDSRTTPHSVAASIAGEFGVPVAVRNVFLDNVNHVQAVMARLEQVEDLARRHGQAIAIGHPRDATLEALSRWLPLVQEKGLVLAPLSAIVRKSSKRESG